MTRPFGRQNDGREETDRLKSPEVITWDHAGVENRGVFFNKRGQPITSYSHGFTRVGAGASDQEDPGPRINADNYPQTSAETEKGSPGAIILEPEQKTQDEMGDGFVWPDDPRAPGANGNGTTCPKSDCLLWAAVGLWLGRWVW